ncbi:MAG: acetylornithine deacetylase/succinyl-diaminopimelate desuccinylase family protein [Alphaproteobacteria bacterium]|nr:acetylornithine deacetylase/succinyl-diaminopimelate desuccinylase family protein [Alphaproteobacteria bacterium]
MLDSLFARIDDQTDALIALTQDLVRIPTINPPGEAYEACADLLGERLKRSGFDVGYVRAKGEVGDSDRYPRTNVVARREGRGPGKTVHFNGHIDVVDPGLGWTVEPFSGVVRNDRIYGRGTCDMKAGIAASVIAAEAILADGVRFDGALEISGTVDEESGGYAGVAHLAHQGFFSKPRVDHVIIPEPLNVDRICIGHRGVWWAEIETFGKIAHGSMPFLGDCAIRHMGAFMRSLEDQLLPVLASRRTAMPVVPEGARQSTLNLAAIHGGLPEHFEGLPSPNVPDRCRLLLDRRFLIEEDLAEVKAEIVKILDDLTRTRPGFRYQVSDVMEVMPTLTAEDADVVRAVAESVTQVLGKPPELVVSPGTYDQKHVHRIGHLKECIAYGPGILDLAHQPDEYVEIEHLVASCKVMAASALRLMGVPLQ